MASRIVWICVLLLTLPLPQAAEAASRVALVIGNGAYQHAGILSNPTNDAADVAVALKSAGFTVTRIEDASKARMESALAAFASEAASSDMAVLFYAGHGMELGGVNYLVPVDARLESEVTAPLQAIKLPDVMDVIGTSQLGVVFLDACRDNPLVSRMARRNGSRAVSRGLARVEPQGNLQVVFAARDGSRAQDGIGRNSPFTTALLQGLRTPGVELRELWGDVRERVLAATDNQQEPYVYGPPLGRTRYYILPPAGGKSALAPAAAPVFDMAAAERAYWGVVDRGDADSVLGYLGRYPQGQYSAQAQQLLAALTRPRPQPAPVSVPASMAGPGGEGGSFRDCADCPEMVRIAGGSFRMGDLSGKGDAGERPVRTVQVRSFLVGKYEVTFEEWDACVVAGGCRNKPRDEGWGRGRRPVIHVRWDDAQQYVQWLSRKTGRQYRLLSEAEWEYVARASTGTEYSWGDGIGCSQARYDNFEGDCGNDRKTVPVGSYGANPWGLHDMHGNAWEWVQDCWNEGHAGAPSNGAAWTTGDCSRRVVRGGSWDSHPRYLRAAHRFGLPTALASYLQGFRLARID